MREELISKLTVAMAELEKGLALSMFVGGHGIMSRLFEFDWRDEALEIHFRLPYGRVLADEAAQQEDDAEIAGAIRMAIALLRAAPSFEAGRKIAVSCNDRGTSYAIYSADGALEDAGMDWSVATGILERILAVGAQGETLSIIWP